MGFLFGNKNKKEKLVAVFDIGSDSVGGAIVRVDELNNSLKIIKSIRTEIAFSQSNDLDILLNNMIKSLAVNVNSIYHSKMGSISEIFCVLASPWYVSENRLIKISKDHSFVFTEKLANDLVSKEISNISIEHKDKYKGQNSIELMEHHIMDVSLNGYNIDNPIGMKTREAEMNMMVSMSSKTCLDQMVSIFEKYFHNTKVSFSSFMFSSYLAVRDKYVSPDSYILLDIGGEITEVGIVSKGVLMSSLSFPFGKKTFYRYISTKLDIEFRDAKELFKLYISNSLSEKRKSKVEPLFLSIEKSWGESFRESVNTLPHTLSLPNTIFITADNDIKGWFTDAIKKEEYAPSILTKYSPEVITLEGTEFLNMCEVSNGACDPFLMIEAIAYMKKNKKI